MGINCWHLQRFCKWKYFLCSRLIFPMVENGHFKRLGLVPAGTLEPGSWTDAHSLGLAQSQAQRWKALFSGSGFGCRSHEFGTGGLEHELSLEPEHWTKTNLKLQPTSHYSCWLIPAVQLLPLPQSQGGFCWQICRAFQGKQDLAEVLGLYIFFSTSGNGSVGKNILRCLG